ncbi:MAG TPA: deoxyribonuclease IV [Clostridia bacterium]|nr:deoxyribonuclease IV [Clostridia bacterium]
MLIGAHLSISKGYRLAVEEARKIGANTLQFFTRNPRGARAKPLDLRDLEKANSLRQQYGFGPLVAHAPYTLNLASPKEDLWKLAIRILREDLEKLDQMGSVYLVVHPGSHTGSGLEQGMERIIQAIKLALPVEAQTMILLEGMAGTGTEIGSTFEQLSYIASSVAGEKVGFCLDSAHLFGAGYDVKDNLPLVLEKVETILGLERVKVFHINDSLYPLGSKKDRHTNLGKGLIGKDALKRLVREKRLQEKIFILETPGGPEEYRQEIAFLRG